MGKDELQRNVLGGELEPCGQDPLTGYQRDGYCRTRNDDTGLHVVCAQVTEEFLQFSLTRGNDLISAVPAFGFPGLRAGDCWCLCAQRWAEAHAAGCAPPVFLARTHERVLRVVELDTLLPFALDLPKHS